MLSEGAIQDILSKPAEQHPQKPVFQILGIKKIQTKGNDGAGNDRYRLVLSDGINLYTSAMLGTQLNDLVTSNQIDVKAVVQLDKYVCNTIQETRKVLIVLEVTIIKPGSEVPGRIGNPKNVNENSSSDRQPQQNGTGAQHGMSGGMMISGGPVGGASRGAGLASATYGSHQPQISKVDNTRTVHPIMSLTPYQNRWTIRARVTSKSNIRTWSNSKGEGRVFNVDLVDESGEIRATGFNDVVDKFYELLEVNKVFYISKCSLRTANKQYSSLKNDYEMYLNNDSIIELCSDPCNLPTIQYNFVQIGDLENISADSLVDILGIVISCDDVTQITTKTTNRQVSKRDITLLDRSEKSVRATLWGDDAEKFDEHVGKNPVLALKGARVSEFGGRSLSILNSTNMRANPAEVKEAYNLRGWYDNVGKNSNIESLSGQRSEGGAMGSNYKTFFQIKEEKLGMGEKADYVTVKASVVYIKKDNCMYKACPSAECNKKVIEEGDGAYRCEKCNKTYPDFKYRLMLLTNLADFTDSQWVTCFQETAEVILNTSADNLGQLKDSGDEQGFDQIFLHSNFKTYTFRIRVKMETYNDETRLKCTCVNVAPLDYKQESRRLIVEIKKLRML